jgi:hypothetical protein
MDLLLDGHLEYQACTEGKGGGLKACWKKLVNKYGDLEIRIYKQDHAKVVLGAKEYKRQERALGKKKKSTAADSHAPKTKKKPAAKPKSASTKQEKTSSKEQPAKNISSDEKPQQQVDIEAAKASQAKLDAFLTKVLG